MPIYEYKCQECGAKFEVFQKVGATNEEVVCPKCGAPRPLRQFSVFASVSEGDSGGEDFSCPTCNLSR